MRVILAVLLFVWGFSMMAAFADPKIATWGGTTLQSIFTLGTGDSANSCLGTGDTANSCLQQ